MSGFHNTNRNALTDDLRLQFSHSSSLSFALPYGLPGNPQSKRPTRLAVETRVHCLWVSNSNPWFLGRTLGD